MDMQAWEDFLDSMEVYYHRVGNEILIPTMTRTTAQQETPHGTIGNMIFSAISYDEDTTGVLHVQFLNSGAYIGMTYIISKKEEREEI